MELEVKLDALTLISHVTDSIGPPRLTYKFGISDSIRQHLVSRCILSLTDLVLRRVNLILSAVMRSHHLSSYRRFLNLFLR